MLRFLVSSSIIIVLLYQALILQGLDDRVKTFLFWNLYRQPLHESIYRIANLYQVDIIILAECTLDPAALLLALNRRGEADYHYAPSPGCQKIQIFTKFSNNFLPVILEADRLTVRQLKTPTMQKDILVAALHFPSKSNWEENDQSLESPFYSDFIREAEKQVGHQRTIVVGDFNMNPYEKGMVNANGFNAVMSRSIALKRERRLQGRHYTFFYNPMWSMMGDFSPGAPGTHYYPPSGHGSYYWHTFDQVLLRPDLLETIMPNSIAILDSDGERSLLSHGGYPDKSWASDHLPLLFRLNIK